MVPGLHSKRPEDRTLPYCTLRRPMLFSTFPDIRRCWQQPWPCHSLSAVWKERVLLQATSPPTWSPREVHGEQSKSPESCKPADSHRWQLPGLRAVSPQTPHELTSSPTAVCRSSCLLGTRTGKLHPLPPPVGCLSRFPALSLVYSHARSWADWMGAPLGHLTQWSNWGM